MKVLIKKYSKGIIQSSVLLIFLLVSCDKGIEPYPEDIDSSPAVFEGKVSFLGDWPEGINRTYIVVFSEPSKFDVNTLQYIIGPIPYGVSEYIYNSVEDNQGLVAKINPGEYPYVIVAQSKTVDLSLARKDWTVAGIYSDESGNPAKLKIEKGKTVSGINIICDFDNPPEQPPVNGADYE